MNFMKSTRIALQPPKNAHRSKKKSQGRTYTLESKHKMGDSLWTPVGALFSQTGAPVVSVIPITNGATEAVLPAVTSSLVTNSPTNGTFSFTDTSATNKCRFYRAVIQIQL